MRQRRVTGEKGNSVTERSSVKLLYSSLRLTHAATPSVLRAVGYALVCFCKSVSSDRSSLCPFQSSNFVLGRSWSSTPKGPRKFHKAQPEFSSPKMSRVSSNQANTTSGGVCL